ncbi:hypothetical protein H839_01086 [Parageobacillus genomosp. 1]|uniref:Uncharacterized protein n=1 Tax=Parageobacillus genomosp. 1 TaxID=1295642 RepID=A0ABC9VI32_9BACL|nr:hypothetical protein [Parageobacillus genomosp. 1]EZP78419.1 hypothetical protein H839_01086 [Parageobacillus genomosp. 1]
MISAYACSHWTNRLFLEAKKTDISTFQYGRFDALCKRNHPTVLFLWTDCCRSFIVKGIGENEKRRHRLLAANGAFLFVKRGGNMRKVVEIMYKKTMKLK